MFTTSGIVNAVSPASGNPICLPLEVTVGPEWQRLATTPETGTAFVSAKRDRTPESKWSGSPGLALSTAAKLNALSIPEIDGRTPHPPHRSALETKASFAQTAAAPRFCPPTPLRRLRQSRALGSRACAHRNRWGCRGEAWRSLRSSALHHLPCKTASHRGAYLLGCTPHRSTQCRAAPMDYIGRHKGWGAHCVSHATTDRFGEDNWRSPNFW